MRFLCLALLGAALLLLAGPPPAHAEAPATRGANEREPAGYRQAIQGALQEFELANYVEAREQFAQAHALFPNARTLRGLGISEFELRNYIECISYLEQALASEVKALDGELLRETEALLKRARGYVGQLRFRLQPAKTSVLVDGLSSSLHASSLTLAAGNHVLEFRAEGYAAERRAVNVRGGQTELIDVELAALSASAPLLADSAATSGTGQRDAPAAEPVPLYKRWWLWTIVGVVVAGAATGTALALSANKDTQYKALPSDQTPPGASLQPLLAY